MLIHISFFFFGIKPNKLESALSDRSGSRALTTKVVLVDVAVAIARTERLGKTVFSFQFSLNIKQRRVSTWHCDNKAMRTQSALEVTESGHFEVYRRPEIQLVV